MDGRFDGALLCAHQAVSEAREEMKAVVANAQLFAAQHPTSVMIAHNAQRRQAQENELAIYLMIFHTELTRQRRRTLIQRHSMPLQHLWIFLKDG